MPFLLSSFSLIILYASISFLSISAISIFISSSSFRRNEDYFCRLFSIIFLPDYFLSIDFICRFWYFDYWFLSIFIFFLFFLLISLMWSFDADFRFFFRHYFSFDELSLPPLLISMIISISRLHFLSLFRLFDYFHFSTMVNRDADYYFLLMVSRVASVVSGQRLSSSSISFSGFHWFLIDFRLMIISFFLLSFLRFLLSLSRFVFREARGRRFDRLRFLDFISIFHWCARLFSLRLFDEIFSPMMRLLSLMPMFSSLSDDYFSLCAGRFSFILTPIFRHKYARCSFSLMPLRLISIDFLSIKMIIDYFSFFSSLFHFWCGEMPIFSNIFFRWWLRDISSRCWCWFV